MRILTKAQVKEFEIYLYEDEKSDNTIEKYLRDIRFFMAWVKDREIDKTAILEYKYLLCEKYAPRSVNAALSSLNAIFTFLDWHELKVKSLKIQRQIFVDREKELIMILLNKIQISGGVYPKLRLFLMYYQKAGDEMTENRVKNSIAYVFMNYQLKKLMEQGVHNTGST